MAGSDDFLNQPSSAGFTPTIDGPVIDDRNGGKILILGSQYCQASRPTFFRAMSTVKKPSARY